MAKTNTTTGEPEAESPMTPAWLYDEIMSRIEPELMIANAEIVEEMYRRNGETDAEKQLRLERYKAAYSRFEAAMDKLHDGEMAKIKADRQAKMATEKKKSDTTDQASLKALEDDFSDEQL